MSETPSLSKRNPQLTWNNRVEEILVEMVYRHQAYKRTSVKMHEKWDGIAKEFQQDEYIQKNQLYPVNPSALEKKWRRMKTYVKDKYNMENQPMDSLVIETMPDSERVIYDMIRECMYEDARYGQANIHQQPKIYLEEDIDSSSSDDDMNDDEDDISDSDNRKLKASSILNLSNSIIKGTEQQLMHEIGEDQDEITQITNSASKSNKRRRESDVSTQLHSHRAIRRHILQEKTLDTITHLTALLGTIRRDLEDCKNENRELKVIIRELRMENAELKHEAEVVVHEA